MYMECSFLINCGVMSALLVGCDEGRVTLSFQMFKSAQTGIISFVGVQVSADIRTGDSPSKCRNWELGGSKTV
jgi:hypothetical protein